MKKTGFTLIELLAVIVILAIISLITTPMILNVIEKSKIGAAESSALGYVDAIEKYMITNQVYSNEINDGIYLVNSEELKNISYKGKGPTVGKIIIKDSNVEEAELCINNKSVYYNGSKSSVITDYNYCTDDFNNEITLINGENKVSKKIGFNTKTDFDLTINEDQKAVRCNNGAELSYVENKLNITNIDRDVTCQIYHSLKDAVESSDTSNNYILMLNDETNASPAKATKDITIELNGKTVKSAGIDVTDTTWSGKYELLSVSDGHTILNDSIGTGGFETGVSSRAISVSSNGNLIINGGNYNGRQSVYVTLSIDGIQYLEINNGNFYTKFYESIGINTAGNSNPLTTLIINDGYFESSKDNVMYVYGNANLKLEINGGTYIGKDNSIGIMIDNRTTDNVKININGGTFITNNTTIKNGSSAALNISDNSGKLYISSLNEYGIRNDSTGKLAVSGNRANQCTSNSSDMTSGLCINGKNGIFNMGNLIIKGGSYITKVDSVYNRSIATINDGYFVSDNTKSLTCSDYAKKGAICYVNGGYFENKNLGETIDGKKYGTSWGAIGVESGGTLYANNFTAVGKYPFYIDKSAKLGETEKTSSLVYLCSGKIIASEYDLVGDGILYYSDKVIFTNATNIPTYSPLLTMDAHPNYNGTC